ncbi:MAG: hypothetical protein ACJASQ_001648 [Crocinitomicaceae bacterium]|jgi:hypothetical protein
MEPNRDITVNALIETKYFVTCQNCKIPTKHHVITSAYEEGRAPMEEYGDWYYWTNKYEIIQCLGCETVSFRLEHANSEEYDHENGENSVNEQIYPRRSKETWPHKSFFNVPINLRRIYRETIDCYNNENFTLCGAGIRAMVEGLCQVNGIIDGQVEYKDKSGNTKTKKRKDLQGKINGLFEKGKLTKDNAEILHEHRFLGNEAIHELSCPPKEDLTLAIEIIENVFDTLFEIPNKASQLKFKRLAKKKS